MLAKPFFLLMLIIPAPVLSSQIRKLSKGELFDSTLSVQEAFLNINIHHKSHLFILLIPTAVNLYIKKSGDLQRS